MANTTIPMTKVKQVLQMHEQGSTHRGITKALGVHRRTVGKYVGLMKLTGLSVQELVNLPEEELEGLLLPNAPQMSDAQEDILRVQFERLERDLPRGKTTRMLVWEQYHSEYPEGLSYSWFCDRYVSWRKKKEVYLPQTHVPGDKLYCDFAGRKLRITDRETGHEREVEVFVAVLGASNYTYVEATLTQQRPDVLQALSHTLGFLGGVPRAIVPDNMKSLVDTGSSYAPRVNAEAEDFANHYQTVILPTRPRKPKDKAKVEGAVKINYNWLYTALEKGRYYSIGELNEAIRRELIGINNRPMQQYQKSRTERFKELDQPVLMPLPDHPYEHRRFCKCCVLKNNHVYLKEDRHYYSVPFEYVGKTVKLVYSPDFVEVYFERKRIAAHPRNRFARDGSGREYTTLPEHLPAQHQYVLKRSRAYFLECAETIHPTVKTYLEGIFSTYKHPEQAYKSCEGILKLAARFGRDRLVNACLRAASFQVFHYDKIHSILKNGLDLTNPPDLTPPPLPAHNNIRGGDYYF